MIYFFLRAHSFFTLQFLKAISKFQFHAVSNWLLENVLFYLTTAFLYLLFYLSMNLLNSSHAENKTLSLNNTRSPVLQWEFKIPLSSVIILKYIFSTGTRRERHPDKRKHLQSKRMIKRLRMLRPVALPSPACSLFGVLLQTM